MAERSADLRRVRDGGVGQCALGLLQRLLNDDLLRGFYPHPLRVGRRLVGGGLAVHALAIEALAIEALAEAARALGAAAAARRKPARKAVRHDTGATVDAKTAADENSDLLSYRAAGLPVIIAAEEIPADLRQRGLA